MGQSLSQESDISTSTLEISRTYKVHYRVYKSVPVVPILSRMNLVQIIPSYSLRHISILFPICTSVQSVSFL